jgi:hypothetical protein
LSRHAGEAGASPALTRNCDPDRRESQSTSRDTNNRTPSRSGAAGGDLPTGDPNARGSFACGRVESSVRNMVIRADGKMVNVLRKQGQLLVCTG